MPVTPGMKGSGFYDRHSTAQLASIHRVFDWIDDALASMPLPPSPQPFTVLDLGSSEGNNALVAMNRIIEVVRRHKADQLMQTIFSDLPSSNFNRLFRNVHDARTADRIPAGVFASAAGGSFYEQLLPPRSVHFAMAFNSLLWLDELPAVPLPDFIVYRRPHPPRPGLHVAPETTAAFLRQADRDLLRFLQARAQELTPGGKLLIASPGDSAEKRLTDGFYDVFNDGCLDLVADGLVTRQRYEQFTMPVYFRTVEETLAPLQRADSPVKEAFTIDRATSLEVPTPFFVEFDRSGDAAKLADDYMGFLRACSEPVVRAALVGDDGDGSIIDELYRRIHARMKAEPQRYRFDYLLTVTLFTRC